MGLRTDPWALQKSQLYSSPWQAARRHGRIAVQDYVLTLQFMKYVEEG